jgi:hypothetical protein
MAADIVLQDAISGVIALCEGGRREAHDPGKRQRNSLDPFW